MELNSKQKRQRALLEIKDILSGAAFPFMLQLVLSASIILYADYNADKLVQGFILVVGETMLLAAYLIFGRQNGVSAYKKYVVASKKREMGTDDIKTYYGTGEYAAWKGVVIGGVTVLPFVFFQLIECLAPNVVCEFLLKYAFGWAAYPFIVLGVKLKWLDFIWVIVPIGAHVAAYLWGGRDERNRQRVAEVVKKRDGRDE